MRRWDIESGALIGKPLSGHEDRVTCVATSGDGKLIVSMSGDETIRRWAIGDPIHGHERSVTGVAMSGDGKVIVSGSEDKSVRRWDAKSGDILATQSMDMSM